MPQADPGASSKREGQKRTQTYRHHLGAGATTTPCYRENIQAEKPRGMYKVTEQVRWHWKLQQTPSLGRLCIRGAGPDSLLL